MPRLTFLSHFVICLAVGSAVFFAAINGVPQTIWADDLSHMTSVIALLFVGASIYLGRQAWIADDPSSSAVRPSSDFGHLAERLSVMAGFVGTAIGLSLQAKALAGGSASFTALATSLFTTACGGAAAALLAVMTFNLEAGIRRAGATRRRVLNWSAGAASDPVS
jgi:drug/metabolite transporter (DMT)-like permease